VKCAKKGERKSTGVVATSEVVCCILLSTDKLLRVEQLAVCAGPNFINDSGLKIYKNCTRHVLSCTSLAEEGVESIVTSTFRLIARHMPISLIKHHTTQQRSTPTHSNQITSSHIAHSTNSTLATMNMRRFQFFLRRFLSYCH